MKTALFPVLGVVLIALVSAGVACAQGVEPVVPPLSPASAPTPAIAASKPIQMRSPAVRAAEKANEPGTLQPEQRVIPQISVPLKRRDVPSPATPAASRPLGSVAGTVNDGAARCIAVNGAAERAACERGLPASGR